MRLRNPNNRALFVLKAVEEKKPPENALEQAYYSLLETGESAHQTLLYATEIYNKPIERYVLNAFLLAGAEDKQLEFHLRIPIDVTAIYRHLFFDLTQFRDELDILSWVSEKEYGEGSRKEVELLKQALLGGLDSLLWVYSRNKEELNPRKVLESIMADAYFRAKIHRSAPIGSKVAKEAQAYMATALKAGDILARQNLSQPSSTVNDIMIKLGHRELTSGPADPSLADTELLH